MKDNTAKRATIEIVVFTKGNGPLTKRISLAADGAINSDGAACVMSRGIAQRVEIADVTVLAALIDRLKPSQALALGSLRAGLPAEVTVVTKDKINGQERSDIIARTDSAILYKKGRPAFALLDFDSKGMPPEAAAEISRLGGFWPALCSVLPALISTAHLTRLSTSAGLFRADTGEKLVGSGGLHGYVEARDGADIERFLRALHGRCWLAGLGWLMVGAGGQLLERSIVDRMVGAPERLVFEGGPILVPPLQQDRESRRPVTVIGEALDTAAACPPLSIAENAKLRELKAKQAHRLAPEAAKVRAAFIADRQAKGTDERAAIRQCEGILLSGVVLPFDDPGLAGCIVADVLADPDRFVGETLADPLEGVSYGRGKAKVMRRADGTPWIKSFAHGRATYELKYDARAVRAMMESVPADEAARIFVKLAANADLDHMEIEELRNLAAARSGFNKRTIAAMLKESLKQRTARQIEELRIRHLAERLDPRPSIGVPAIDDPWLPHMKTFDGVLGDSSDNKPPARDIDGVVARARKLLVPSMHAFTRTTSNQEDNK